MMFSPSVVDEIRQDLDAMRAQMDLISQVAEDRGSRLDECYAFLMRLEREGELIKGVPVPGAVKVAARALLLRHGVLVEAAEPQEDKGKVIDLTHRGQGY